MVNGEPKCNFDHTQPDTDRPNCCTGKYSLVVRTWNGAGATPGYQSTSTLVDWGGKESNCLAGAAMDTQSRDKDGHPETDISYVEGTGLNRTYTINSPLKLQTFSNLYAANYFDPADHAPNTVPKGHILIPFGYRSSPYYELDCLDRALEYKARIRIMIREWNTYSEWQKKGSGDSNVIGFEPNPWGAYGLGDLFDWGNFPLVYPNSR